MQTNTLRSARRPALAMLCFALAAWSGALMAVHSSWHQESGSYEVHLGIATLAAARADAELVRLHAARGHGREVTGTTRQHVMVAVFRKSDGRRVANAEVFAEVLAGHEPGVLRSARRLEPMPLSSGPTFCNFFDPVRAREYTINVSVREPGMQPEIVTFVQKGAALLR